MAEPIPVAKDAEVECLWLPGTTEKAIDRESAVEKRKGRAAASADVAKPPANALRMGGLKDLVLGQTGPRDGHRERLAESADRSAMRSVGSAVGRQIGRGSIFGGSSRRRRGA
jgi:uncharacterized protein